MQEDVIELKNIFIPDPKAEIDMSCILGNERKISHVISSENFFKVYYHCLLSSCVSFSFLIFIPCCKFNIQNSL